MFSGSLDPWGTASSTHFTLSNTPFDTKGTLLNAFVANAPQLLFSICYLTLSGLLTCIALAHEWNSFAVKRKGLRVTQPEGDQRGSYFLQLPFRWAIPVNAVSGLLHWLASQTLFFIRLDKFDKVGNLIPSESISACSLSKSSGLALLHVGVFLLIGVRILSMVRFEARIPFAASCSWVISAACHPPFEEERTAIGRVKWGVVQGESFSETGLQHCSFSKHTVRRPKVGTRYK